MTVNQARKLLGSLAFHLSDEELEEEIRTSEFLVSVAWDAYKENKKLADSKERGDHG